MRNAAPLLPLILALAGTQIVPGAGEEGTGRARAFRPAHAVAAVVLELSEDEREWLDEHNPFGLPRHTTPRSLRLVSRRGYTLAHNKADRIADWVSWHVTKEYAEGDEPRPGTEAFKPDPRLPPGERAELADYRGSGYDRGHQCPNADSRGRGMRVVLDSFYLSNMTPQSAALNRKAWADLEGRVRDWAVAAGEVWVVSGPVFLDEDQDGVVEYWVIGRNRVAVPTHYFKVVVRKGAGGQLEALALLIPNKKFTGAFRDHLVSIDEVEEVTGLDLFPDLPDAVEVALEAAEAPQLWN